MIIIGNEHISNKVFKRISNINDIKNTKPNSVLIFSYDIELIKYCKSNSIQSAVKIKDIKQAIFCNCLEVDFLIVNNDISKQIQNIAQNYMFDAKVLQVINDDDEIPDLALNEIDGCIYNKLL